MAQFVSIVAGGRAAEGMQVARSVDLQRTGTNPKAAPGKVYGWWIYNAAASARFVKLYDKATAPTSSDTPLVTVALAAASQVSLSLPAGIAFPAGIGWRACTGLADNDNTAPTAGDVAANLFYA